MPSRTAAKRNHQPAPVDRPVSRYPLPALEDLPADLQGRIVEVQSKTGFIPNVFLVLARRPDEFRAFFAYYDALMLRQGGLSKAEREMIVVATSAANACPYCVVAHGAVLRIYAKNPHPGRPARGELSARGRHAAGSAPCWISPSRWPAGPRKSRSRTWKPCACRVFPTRISGTSAR